MDHIHENINNDRKLFYIIVEGGFSLLCQNEAENWME